MVNKDTFVGFRGGRSPPLWSASVNNIDLTMVFLRDQAFDFDCLVKRSAVLRQFPGGALKIEAKHCYTACAKTLEMW